MTAEAVSLLPAVESAVAVMPVVESRLDRLVGLLDPAWRPGEWDPAAQTIRYDPDGALVALRSCLVEGCDNVTTKLRLGLCVGCDGRWRRDGRPTLSTWLEQRRPDLTWRQQRSRRCIVVAAGGSCPRPARGRLGLCNGHEQQQRKLAADGGTLDEFLAGATPFDDLGRCRVIACDIAASTRGLCYVHHAQWKRAGRPAAAAFAAWAVRASPVPDMLVVCLRGLHRLAATEVLYALQQRDREQARTSPAAATAIVNVLRSLQAVSVLDVPLQAVPSSSTSLAVTMRDRLSVAYSDPARERSKLVWDARVFGHPSAVTWDFSAIRQDWLRDVAQGWAFVAQTRLAAHNVQSKINAVAGLSACLADLGSDDKTAVGRAEIEAYAIRLNLNVGRGVITETTRAIRLKQIRQVLDESRRVGLLAGVADTFTITKDLIPRRVQTEE